MEGCNEEGARIFSVVPSGNGHKMKHRRFSLNIRKHFFTVSMAEHWQRFPREVVKSPSLEIFKNHLYTVLSHVVLHDQVGWTRLPPEPPSNLNHSVLL